MSNCLIFNTFSCGPVVDATRPFKFWEEATKLLIDQYLKPVMPRSFEAPLEPLYRDPTTGSFYCSMQFDHGKLGHTLWLDRSVFADHPKWWDQPIVIEVNARSQVWRRVDEISALNARSARGLVVGYRPNEQRPNAHFSIQLNALSPAVPDRNAQIVGWFNPLWIRIDPLASNGFLTSTAAKDFWYRYCASRFLLDVTPEFPAESLPRVELHYLYAGAGAGNRQEGRSLPPVDRLLLASDWPAAEAPFLMLDHLAGNFEIDAPVDGGEPQLSWRPPSVLPPAFEWLATWCRDRLRLGEKKDAQPKIIAESGFALEHPAHDCPGSPAYLASARLQSAVAELFATLGTFEASTEILMPQSPMFSRLPPAPAPLDSQAGRDWSQFIQVHAIDLCRTPLFGVRNWLQKLLGHWRGQPVVNSKWCCADDEWWYPYYWRLLWGPDTLTVEWVAPKSGRFGEKLGSLTLGARPQPRRPISEFQLA